MHTQAGFAEVTGARIYYDVAGSGFPLVLIHGHGLDTRMWDDQFAVFSQHHRVIRYDVRGFGQSSLPTSEPYSHADDLNGLLAYLDVSQAYVVGLSAGGQIAINFALTYPALVRALILVDSGLSGHRWSEDWRTHWRAIESAGASAGTEAANQLWLKHPLFAPALEHAALVPRLMQMITAYSGWHWVNQDSHRKSSPPDMQRLDQIKLPTLIIAGERDLPDFLTIAETLRQGIAGAHLVTLPGVGHLANMEAPADFNQIAQDFLRTV